MAISERVYFGAIHYLHDNATGLRPQIEKLRDYVPDFGLAAPCGWGRVPDRGKTDHMLAKPGEQLDDPLAVIVEDHVAGGSATRRPRGRISFAMRPEPYGVVPALG